MAGRVTIHNCSLDVLRQMLPKDFVAHDEVEDDWCDRNRVSKGEKLIWKGLSPLDAAMFRHMVAKKYPVSLTTSPVRAYVIFDDPNEVTVRFCIARSDDRTYVAIGKFTPRGNDLVLDWEKGYLGSKVVIFVCLLLLIPPATPVGAFMFIAGWFFGRAAKKRIAEVFEPSITEVLDGASARPAPAAPAGRGRESAASEPLDSSGGSSSGDSNGMTEPRTETGAAAVCVQSPVIQSASTATEMSQVSNRKLKSPFAIFVGVLGLVAIAAFSYQFAARWSSRSSMTTVPVGGGPASSTADTGSALLGWMGNDSAVLENSVSVYPGEAPGQLVVFADGLRIESPIRTGRWQFWKCRSVVLERHTGERDYIVIRLDPVLSGAPELRLCPRDGDAMALFLQLQGILTKWAQSDLGRGQLAAVSRSPAELSTVSLSTAAQSLSSAEVAAPKDTPAIRSELDLDRYCKARGFEGVVNRDGTGYGWSCVPGNAGLDINQLCREQFGSAYHAFLASAPPGRAGDWRCRAE